MVKRVTPSEVAKRLRVSFKTVKDMRYKSSGRYTCSGGRRFER